MKLMVLCLIICASVVLVDSKKYCFRRGEKRQVDCMTCTCDSKWRWDCRTRPGCTSRPGARKCIPGSSFSLDCVPCHCWHDGSKISLCFRIAPGCDRK